MAVPHPQPRTFVAAFAAAACLAGLASVAAPSPHPQRLDNVRLAGDVTTASLQPAAGQYVPLSPQRIATVTSLASGSTATFTPAADADVPATGVSALVFSLTATNGTTTSGALKAYAAGSAEPVGTCLSYGPSAQYTSTAIVSKVGTGNAVTLANTGATVRVVVDLLGYYTGADAVTAGSTYVAVPPQQIASRQSVAAKGSLTVRPLGQAGIPTSGVSAVVVDVTVNSAAAGVLKVYPTGWTPQTAEANFRPNADYLSRVPVKLGADGTITLTSTSVKTAVVDVAVVGYYQTPGQLAGGATFVPVAPSRVLSKAVLASGSSWSGKIAGSYGVPATGVSDVAVHLSATNATANGSASTYPTGVSQPAYPQIYERPSEPSDVAPVSGVNASGEMSVLANSATVTLSLDVVGYFQPASVSSAPDAVSVSGDPATVSWSSPVSDGGAPVTGYTVTVTGTVDGVAYNQSTETSATSLNLPLLPRGRSFAVQVVAHNSVGDSPAGTATLSLPFQHPGVLLNRDQLDFVKAQVAAGVNPWKAAYTTVASRSFAQLTYTPHPAATLARSSGSATDLANDDIAAYTDALLFYLSGNAQYGDKAVSILNGWAKSLTTVAGDAQLDATWAAEMMPRAAEILRYGYVPAAGKPALDVAGLSRVFRTVLLPQLNQTTNGYTWSNGNWAESMADGTIDIGVFTDDASVFDTGLGMWRERVRAYLYSAGDGSSPAAPAGGVYDTNAKVMCYWAGLALDKTKAPAYCSLPSGFKVVDHQVQETCRDMTHVAFGTEALSYAAETARNAGVDLYGEQASRIVGAMEFSAQHDLEALNAPTAGSSPSGGTGSGTVSGGVCGTGTLAYGGVGWETGFVTAYNEFHSRLGYTMPYTEQMMAKIATITNKPNAGLVAALHVAWTGLTNVGTP